MYINNETWLIENGVLKEYRGTSKEVEIPEGVTEIGNEAFAHKDITKVKIPNTVRIIGESAFADCHLTSVEIPDSVEVINKYAFTQNKIKNLKLGENIKKIGESAFASNKIETLEIPNRVQRMEMSCFSRNPIRTFITGSNFNYGFFYHSDNINVLSSIKKIIINHYDDLDTKKLLGLLLTLENSKLQKVIVRNVHFFQKENFDRYGNEFRRLGIKFEVRGTVIKDNMLQGYKRTVSKVTFSSGNDSGDSYIEHLEFYDITTIKLLNNDTWLIEDGTLKEYRKREKHVEIPNGVIVIGPQTFLDSHIESVIIPETVKEIDINAFCRCNIEELIIPDSVVYLGSFSFRECKINSIKFGKNVKIIGRSAFYENKLETVELPESLTKLGEYAFAYNYLKSITIPGNLKAIPTRTFSNNNINQIFLGNVEKIEENAFYQNNITSLILPKSLKEIQSGAFANNRIKTLVIEYPICIKDVFFQGNPVETLYLNADANLEFLKSQYSTSGVAVYGIDNIFPELKEVYIENHHRNIIEYLTTLSHLKTIKKIVISELSPIERLKLAKVFKTFKNRGVEIIIGAKIDFPEEEFETKVPNRVSLTSDSEIDELHNKILNLTRLMSEEERKVIHDEVTSKIDKYKEDLLNYKAEYDLEESNEISLTLEPNDPKSLKERLIRYLDQVIMSLELKESHFKELENISRYREMLNNPNPEEPLQIETDEDAIKYIIWVSCKYQNDEIKNRLKKILEDATTELSKDLVKKDFVLVNINPIQEFWKKVQTLKDIVEKYRERCDWANEKYTSIVGGNESSLSEIVKETNAIINKLDEKNQSRFFELLQTITAKQKNTQHSILEDLDGNNKSDTPENMELEFRKDLQELLIELNKIAKQSMDARTILNGLNNSLEILNGESTESNSVIEEEVINILKLLENESITDEQKTNTLKLLKTKLEKWIEILLTTNIDEIRVKGEFENDPFFKEWENMKPGKIVFTDSKQIVLVAILKELYGIKNKIEGYIEKNISYKEITKSLETRRQTK